MEISFWGQENNGITWDVGTRHDVVFVMAIKYNELVNKPVPARQRNLRPF